MAEDNKNLNAENTADVSVEVTKKANKKSPKTDAKPNFFVRIWRKLVKLYKDLVSELKKVTWTSKSELWKSTKLVVITVVAVGVAIALVDTVSSFIVNTLAGLIG